jgi:hypothetical protein
VGTAVGSAVDVGALEAADKGAPLHAASNITTTSVAKEIFAKVVFISESPSYDEKDKTRLRVRPYGNPKMTLRLP